MWGINKLSLFRRFPRYQSTPTVSGNAYTHTGNTKFGTGSVVFDGTSDDVRVYDTAMALGSGAFTVELWLWINSTSISNGLFDFRTSGSNQVAPSVNVTTLGQLRLNVNGVQTILGASGSVTVQTWHHVALVRSGTTTRFYLNGTQSGSDYTDSNNYTFSQLIIGSLVGGNNNPCRGFIDEFRISRIARYTGTFTPSSTAFTNDENTLLLLHFDDYVGSTTIVDDVGDVITQGTRTALTPTNSGSTKISTSQFKFGSSSTFFNSVNSLLYTSDTLCFGFWDFTIECFFRASGSFGGGQFILFDQRNNFTASQIAPQIYLSGTGTAYPAYYVNGAERIAGAANSISGNTWYHIAVSRSGSNTRMFIDGVQVGSTYTDTNVYVNQPFSVGAFNNLTQQSNGWVGWIDEVRVSNVARYTASFSVPSTAFAHDANTVLLLHMEGANNSTTFTDSTS